jgi:hypothetical protein
MRPVRFFIGAIATREEYRSHHLQDDVQFTRTARNTRVLIRVTVFRDAAWIISRNNAACTFNGRTIDSNGGQRNMASRGR